MRFSSYISSTEKNLKEYILDDDMINMVIRQLEIYVKN